MVNSRSSLTKEGIRVPSMTCFRNLENVISGPNRLSLFFWILSLIIPDTGPFPTAYHCSFVTMDISSPGGVGDCLTTEIQWKVNENSKIFNFTFLWDPLGTVKKFWCFFLCVYMYVCMYVCMNIIMYNMMCVCMHEHHVQYVIYVCYSLCRAHKIIRKKLNRSVVQYLYLLQRAKDNRQQLSCAQNNTSQKFETISWQYLHFPFFFLPQLCFR